MVALGILLFMPLVLVIIFMFYHLIWGVIIDTIFKDRAELVLLWIIIILGLIGAGLIFREVI